MPYAFNVTRTFLPLTNRDAFQAMLAETEPIVVFKHSPTCGISAQAHEELTDWLRDTAAPVPVYVVHVQQHRDVSNEIAAHFGIRHESPQVLVLEAGTVRWSGSHFHVNARELQRALDSLAAPPVGV